jgi:hypothetical protein
LPDLRSRGSARPRPEAQDCCDFLVSRHGEPVDLLAVTVRPELSAEMLDTMLGAAIGDRITLDAGGDSALGIEREFFIESIALGRFDGPLAVVFEIADAAADAGYWLLARA